MAKRLGLCVLTLALLLGWSGLALAQDARLYELTENMKLVGGKVFHRKATSELMGVANAGTPICPLPVNCTINATGSDNISLATGLGKFSGTFTVVVQGDNPTDSPEYVVAKGKFSGKMDFSPAVVLGLPWGTVVGKMMLDGGGGTVPFTGTFRLPFVLPGVPDASIVPYFGALPLNPFPTQFYVGQTVTDPKTGNKVAICTTPNPLDSCSRPVYVVDIESFVGSDGGTGWYPVLAGEYGLGWPTVRFDIQF